MSHSLTDDGWHRIPIPTGTLYVKTYPYERTDRARLIAITSQYHGGCSLLTVSYADTDWAGGAVTVYQESDSSGTDARSRAGKVVWELGSLDGVLHTYRFDPEYREKINGDDT